MQYISAQQAAQKWGISKRRVQVLCTENRIKDAVRIGNMWAVPEDAQKPADSRVHTPCASPRPTTREARAALKKLTADSYGEICGRLCDPTVSKMVFASLLATAISGSFLGECTPEQEGAICRTIGEELLGPAQGADLQAVDCTQFSPLLPALKTVCPPLCGIYGRYPLLGLPICEQAQLGLRLGKHPIFH